MVSRIRADESIRLAIKPAHVRSRALLRSCSAAQSSGPMQRRSLATHCGHTSQPALHCICTTTLLVHYCGCVQCCPLRRAVAAHPFKSDYQPSKGTGMTKRIVAESRRRARPRSKARGEELITTPCSLDKKMVLPGHTIDADGKPGLSISTPLIFTNGHRVTFHYPHCTGASASSTAEVYK